MSADFQEFLAGRLPFPGLMGWGALLRDRSISHQSYVDWLSPARIEQVLHRLNQFAESGGVMEKKPARFVWTFENLLLHLACREDGACLVLLVENRAEAPSIALSSVVEEFLQSRASN